MLLIECMPAITLKICPDFAWVRLKVSSAEKRLVEHHNVKNEITVNNLCGKVYKQLNIEIYHSRVLMTANLQSV